MKRIVTFILIAYTLLIISCAHTTDTQNGGKATLHYRMGVNFLEKKELTNALREFLKAEKLNPKNSYVLNAIGFICLRTKKYGEAEKYLKRAIENQPDYSDAYNNLGVVYLQTEKWDSALQCFQKVLDDPLYATPEFALNNIGQVHYHKGQIDQAIENFKKAINISKSNPLFHYNLGLSYHEHKKYNDALSEFNIVIELLPKRPEAYYQKGIAYLKLNDKKNAEVSFKKVLELAKNPETRKLASTHLKELTKEPKPIPSTPISKTEHAKKQNNMISPTPPEVKSESEAETTKDESPLPITPSLPKVTQKSEVDKAEIAPPIPKIEQEKKEDRISGTPSAPKITHDTTQKGIKEFYVVQVASCKSEKKAYDISNRLKKKGYPSYVMQVEIKDKGTYHRILIGNYDNKENAKKMMHQLKQDEQFSPIITRIKQ